LRPVRSNTLMWHLLLETTPIRTGLDVAPRWLPHHRPPRRCDV